MSLLFQQGALGMALYKRGKTWWYKFAVDGIKYRESSKTNNKELARNIETARRREIISGRAGLTKPKLVPTFQDFHKELLTEIEHKSADHPRTIEFYKQTMARITGYKPIASAKLDDIGDEVITKFVANQKEKGFSQGTIRLRLSVIRQTLLLALQRDIIGKVPRQSFAKWFDNLTARRREFVLSGELRDEFIAGLQEPCKTVARFLVDVGLRISECCALTWDRVLSDPDRGITYIFVDRGKSKKARRYIPLTVDALAIIEKQKTLSRSQFVFVRFGERVDKDLWYTAALSRHTVSQQFTARRREMGLPDDAVLHSTRHTYLTDLGASGADVFTIKDLAGHASVSTSEGYIHPVSDTLIAAVRRMEGSREKERAARRPGLKSLQGGHKFGHNFKAAGKLQR